MTAVLCGAFFLSGAAALNFESLWFRQAGLVFGNSIWASSVVLPRLGGVVGPALRLFLDEPALLNALRLFMAFVLLPVPAAAMGATASARTLHLAFVVLLDLQRKPARDGRRGSAARGPQPSSRPWWAARGARRDDRKLQTSR